MKLTGSRCSLKGVTLANSTIISILLTDYIDTLADIEYIKTGFMFWTAMGLCIGAPIVIRLARTLGAENPVQQI